MRVGHLPGFIKAFILVPDELMDTPTFKRFNAALDAVFENSEDMEVTVDTGDEEDEEYAPDTLVSKALLAELVNEAAKLKSLDVMNQIRTERLVRLLNILERNIRDGTKLNPNDQDEQNPREQRLWREVTMERVTRSVDSSLIALYIMTSEDMPKEVFIEDVIDRLSQLAKFQLTNTIYPEFDPVYRVNPKKEVIATHTKLKRARAGEVKEKSVLMVYNKLCALVANLAELLNLQILTDSTVLLRLVQVSTNVTLRIRNPVSIWIWTQHLITIPRLLGLSHAPDYWKMSL
eukprot:XP_011667174.1 PREDICTED: nipped-B-like protein A [Strongylocentrotus purpuratus]